MDTDRVVHCANRRGPVTVLEHVRLIVDLQMLTDFSDRILRFRHQRLIVNGDALAATYFPSLDKALRRGQ